MRKRTLPIMPALLASVITTAALAARPAHAQSRLSADPKDQEIQLLKSEIQKLESRVDTLEGLDQKVKVIDRKLEDQDETHLQEAYLNVKYFKEAQLQVGKYKAPLDLERLQSDRDLMFSERSEIQNLVPNRDTGIEVHSESLFDNRLTYQLAYMNGVPNNTAADPTTDIDNNDGKDFIGRIFTTPFKLTENEWLKGLGFGFAGAYG